MRWTIPIYVESGHRIDGGKGHFARPLFFPYPARTELDLERLIQKLTVEVQKELLSLSRSRSHQDLARWTFAPDVAEQRLDLSIDLRRRTAKGRFYFAVITSGDRRVAFCPRLPDVWFEVCRGQDVKARAEAVLTEYFRRQARESDEEDLIRPEDYALPGTAWATSIEFNLELQQSFKPAQTSLQAMLGGRDVASGAEELWQCGRCLNWQYPGDLERAIDREQETARLEQLLSATDRRPVLLLGRRQAGKTALVHEHAFRTTARRKSPFEKDRNLWLLSPQRLVAGMSFVGQWESRLLAIVKEARRRDHTLYFDDFLGLYLAGRTRDSDLNMATVLKPHLERRECRFLAEMTPEAWRVLRERDRGLADQFEVLSVDEVTADATMQILLSVRRELELRLRREFHIDSLPTVIDLQRRYGGDAAFPGKAVRFLKDLALRGHEREITRASALDAFHARSGLAVSFLDPTQKVPRSTIVSALRQEVVGQDFAVDAVADVLSIAKARLNDLRRPLGTLLFLGPTGVGKTQLARATARYLFGDANRLLRFDLNEYVDYGSATRLIGTFADPEGALTSAVRRQPFAVVLFDEIEKAHPEIFDILLQVLGDGRLSDALGRTVSFANTLIILTSNIGVRAAEKSVGFVPDVAGDHTWHKAVERFFRPEFFNRLDRIVPFGKLSTAVVSEVARLALRDILERDGLSRRRCLLTVDPNVLESAASRGSTDLWGARGLKRTLERELIQPLARRLAEIRPGALTRLSLLAGPAGVLVDIYAIAEIACPDRCLATYSPGEGQVWIDKVRSFLNRAEAELAPLRPVGPLTAGSWHGTQAEYFALTDRLRSLKRRLVVASESSHTPLRPTSRISGMSRADVDSDWYGQPKRGHLSADEDFHDMLQDFWNHRQPQTEGEGSRRDVLRACALLQLELDQLRLSLPVIDAQVNPATAEKMDHRSEAVESSPSVRPSASPAVVAQVTPRVGLAFIPLSEADGTQGAATADLYSRPAEKSKTSETALGLCGVEIVTRTALPSDESGLVSVLELSGLPAGPISRMEAGLHLWLAKSGRQHAVIAFPFTWQGDAALEAAWNAEVARRRAWRRDLASGYATVAADPWRPAVLVRLYEDGGLILDFRTSGIVPAPLSHAELGGWLMDALPLPEEFV